MFFCIFLVLLERGSKLRNAMVVSALKSDVESDVPLKDIPLPLSKDNTDALYELYLFFHIPMRGQNRQMKWQNVDDYK